MLEKRAPGWQYLKKVLRPSVNIESKTVDEKFDKMATTFHILVQELNTLDLNCKNYVEGVQELLVVGQSIGILIKDLYNPSLKVKDFHEYASTEISDEELDLWKEIGVFGDLIGNVELSIKEELEILKEKCSSSVREVKLIAKNINSFSIKRRNEAIYDLDNTRSKLLRLKRIPQEELTTKQTQSLKYYEQMSEKREDDYNSINILLKLELPIFFQLVSQIMELIQYIAYYVQVIVCYQFKNNLSNEAGDLRDLQAKVDGSAFNFKVQSAVDRVNQLKIIKFRDNFFSNSLANRPKSQLNRMCEAIFSFEAQQEDDLTIKKGDKIKLQDTKSYWYKGELNGKVGVFPHNYVKIIS